MADDSRLSDPSPMVNGQLMTRYRGRKVRCVVQILESNGPNLVAQASDGQQITVVPLQGSAFTSPFVEITGVVEDNGVVKEHSHIDFGQTFDMTTYNRLVELANNEHQKLFLG